MSTFKDLAVEENLNVGGDASITGTMSASNLKLANSTVMMNALLQISGTTGALNQDADLGELPEGFTSQNTIIIGYTVATVSGAGYVSCTRAVRVYISYTNRLRVIVDNDGYANQDIKIILLRTS